MPKSPLAAYVPIMKKGYTVDRSNVVPPEVEKVNGYAWADVQNRVVHAPHKMSKLDMAHEIGHLFDYNVLNDQDRTRIAKAIRAPDGEPWYGGRKGAAEAFADYYSAAAMGKKPWQKTRVAGGGIRGGNDMPYATIGPKKMAAFRAILDEVAQREGLQSGPLFRKKGKPMTGSNPIEQVG